MKYFEIPCRDANFGALLAMEMKKLCKYILSAAMVVMAMPGVAEACTSAIIGASRSATGHPLLWKNRDTGTEHNFVAKVDPKDAGDIPYVALFNGGDSLLLDAWIGVNEAGFAIMNTASYNLAPDTAAYKDREGRVMTEALRRCRTVGDFSRLLDSLPRPLGVQANFGVIDATGAGGYYEADDYGYEVYMLSDNDDVLLRTNYSYSGDTVSGFGYIRHENERHLLKPYIDGDSVSAYALTDLLSRSFYHSLIGRDFADGDEEWVVDQDFIPRHSTSASVVVEGVGRGEDPRLSMMWTAIGYPPCSYVLPVWVDDVPEELQPVGKEWRSPLCDSILMLKHKAFPIARGSGRRYLHMPTVREISARQRQVSADNYRNGYLRREDMKHKLEKRKK